MISFRYGLVSSRYSLINKVLFLSPLLSYKNRMFFIKITYLYWFVITFFLLKMVLNSSTWSAFDFFIFFFQSKKISHLFDNVATLFFLVLVFSVSYPSMYIVDTFWFTIVITIFCFRKTIYHFFIGFGI